MKKTRFKIAIIYKYIPHYRREFFSNLKVALEDANIDLTLVYGQPGNLDVSKKDMVDIGWAKKIENKIFKIAGKEFYWQPVFSLIKDADLVIVEQANKLLVNYVLMIRNILGIQRMAFWGHGRNFQAKKGDMFSEWVKRIISTKASWWFAYNELGAKYVRQLGFPLARITSVQNAIDTRYLTNVFQNLKEEDIRNVCRQLGIKSQHVCIYAGGMYPDKRLNFLLTSLILIRQQLPDFEMIFIGSGVDACLVKDFATRYNWIHYVGSKFDKEKIPYFAISKLLLIPGAIGLGILDSFVLETPLVTTNISYHGPEIAYLENNLNGIMVEESENALAYANAVLDLLRDETHRQRLIKNCIIAREKYTIENMVKNFSDGVIKALAN